MCIAFSFRKAVIKADLHRKSMLEAIQNHNKYFMEWNNVTGGFILVCDAMS